MSHSQVIDLINDHRAQWDLGPIDHSDDVVKARDELARIEEIAQFGSCPFDEVPEDQRRP
jgi:hypothetical protein